MTDKTKKPDMTPEEAQARMTLARAAAKVFGTPEGKLVADYLLSESQAFQSVFQPSSASYFLMGKQEMGYVLYDLIAEASPALIREILTINLDKTVAERRVQLAEIIKEGDQKD